jgi:hypothetical protein
VSDDFSQPDSLLAAAVDRQLTQLEGTLNTLGFTEIRALLIIHCDTAPLGEKDSLVAGFGYDDSRDLLPDLAHHLVAAGRAHGLTVKLVPIGRG